jgi:hypothetical protein
MGDPFLKNLAQMGTWAIITARHVSCSPAKEVLMNIIFGIQVRFLRGLTTT